MEQICLGYRDAWQQGRLPPLLASASLVLDLLCIHPFRDGNGRASRLLTLLVLCRHGYQVGRHISLERIVEETKESYFGALAESSRGWHEAKHTLLPWWNYFLSTLNQAHGELERRVTAAQDDAIPAKTELVRQAALSRSASFTLAEITAVCPTVSTQMIKKTLSDLKREGLVALSGKGRGARWRVKG